MEKEKEDNQAILPIKGAHPSFEEFDEAGNKFIDFLEDKGVSALFYGYAWENDESHIRHISYDMSHDKIQDKGATVGNHTDADELLRDTDYHRREWTAILYEAFSDTDYTDDRMYRIDVPDRTIKSLHSLYVTEPRLVDEDHGDVIWNAY